VTGPWPRQESIREGWQVALLQSCIEGVEATAVNQTVAEVYGAICSLYRRRRGADPVKIAGAPALKSS
jgi:hypothetical protein